MNADGARILLCLRGVEAERHRRRLDPGLGRRTRAIKEFQHRRFSETYSDLLSDSRYAPAANFFLKELYGPYDFTDRDQQFERIVPALVRLFSRDIISTVRALAELHFTSERLDSAMGAALDSDVVDSKAYAAAWRAVGEPSQRELQITLTIEIGDSLRRYTNRTLLRHTLHAMRQPARIAGLGSLQRFLEAGFDTFRDMPDPVWFLRTVSQRERDFVFALFSGNEIS